MVLVNPTEADRGANILPGRRGAYASGRWRLDWLLCRPPTRLLSRVHASCGPALPLAMHQASRAWMQF